MARRASRHAARPAGVTSLALHRDALPQDHLSFSRAFAARFSGDRRYWPERGRWMAWHDPMAFGGDVETCGWGEAPTPLNDMAGVIKESTEGEGREQWCRLNHINGSLALAAEPLAQSEWDTDPDLLALPAGRAVDLLTGERRLQERTDWLTTRAGCDVAGQVSAEWSKFVLETCSGDQEMAEALQLAVGASAFGHNRHHRVDILCGDGGTGKSSFSETIAAALGTYAYTMSPSVLNARTDQHPTGIAALLGKRLVTVPEVTGGTFRAETLKALSGGDTITARFMRQDFFVFRPACSLWLQTNEPPAVRLVDNALRRRIRIWPFEAKPSTPDPKLPERLRSPEVLSGVLRWIVSGAKKYAALDGPFPDCASVREATAQYFEATDSLGAWFAACCTPSPSIETPARDLFKGYGGWCEAEGMRPVSRTAWGTWMGRCAEKRRTKAGNVYAVDLAGV